MRIFSHDQPVVEITATELGKKVGRVLNRVAAGDRVVITRNGREVAVILSLAAGIAEVLEAWRVGTTSG